MFIKGVEACVVIPHIHKKEVEITLRFWKRKKRGLFGSQTNLPTSFDNVYICVCNQHPA